MDWLNKTMTKLWPYIDEVSVGAVQDLRTSLKLTSLKQHAVVSLERCSKFY